MMMTSLSKTVEHERTQDINEIFRNSRILVVDDDSVICDILSQYLGQLGFHCETTSDPQQAAEWLKKNEEYDVILSDIYMPDGVTGHDLLSIALETSPLTPFVLMTGHPTLDNAIDAIRLGAYDYLTKPFNLEYVNLTLTRALHYRNLAVQNRSYQENLEVKVNERSKELQNFLFYAVQSLSNALEAKDPYTQGHANQVSNIVLSLARELNVDESHDVALRLAAQLHDIGKIGIPDSILLKKGELTQEEYKIMKSHSVIGYNILSPIPSLKEVSRYVYEHHERWDGSGYPRGLQGEEIHPNSRLLMVAEVFDALATKRVYKNAWSKNKILTFFDESSGKAFDPVVADAFIRLIKKGQFDDLYNLESGEE